MNYRGLSRDVADIFEEAQQRATAARLMGDTSWHTAQSAPHEPIAPLVIYERATCARCGDPVELRPGVRHPVHLGKARTCANRLARST